MIWATWWAWGAVALGLAILEVLMPTQIFLGFAIGAAFVGGVFAFDWPLASFMAGSLPWTLVVFRRILADRVVGVAAILPVAYGQREGLGKRY